jgi:acylpyruvate hydrolase
VRLATFLPPGETEPRAGEVRGEEVVAFTDGSSVLDRLRTGDRTPADGPATPLHVVELLAPVPRPRAIFGIGLNYREHAREQGRELPERPIVFLKLPSSSASPNAPVHKPDVVEQLDYEGELAVVIGGEGRVAGYAVANDLSARDLQRSEPQWTRAKGFDGACPWGPWITTADEVPEPERLALRTHVNDELRQDATTADLIFGIDHVVAFIAETIALQPGDLILTGTPSGVGEALRPSGLLRPGDVVRIEVEGLGSIEHAVR